jgi:hypothetical protein
VAKSTTPAATQPAPSQSIAAGVPTAAPTTSAPAHPEDLRALLVAVEHALTELRRVLRELESRNLPAATRGPANLDLLSFYGVARSQKLAFAIVLVALFGLGALLIAMVRSHGP